MEQKKFQQQQGGRSLKGLLKLKNRLTNKNISLMLLEKLNNLN